MMFSISDGCGSDGLSNGVAAKRAKNESAQRRTSFHSLGQEALFV
jgi:hypothetical protein